MDLRSYEGEYVSVLCSDGEKIIMQYEEQE